MTNRSYPGASAETYSSHDKPASHEKAINTAVKAASVYAVFAILDAVAATAMGAGMERVPFAAALVGGPAIALRNTPSQMALGILIAMSGLSVLAMLAWTTQGGGVIALALMALNAAFCTVFARGFLALGKSNDTARP